MSIFFSFRSSLFLISMFFATVLQANEECSFYEQDETIFGWWEDSKNVTRHNPQIVMDANGNHIGVWEIKNEKSSAIEGAIKLASESTWKAPIILSTTSFNPSQPKIVMNQKGQALIVWLEKNQNISRLCSITANSENFGTMNIVSPNGHYVLDEFIPTINDNGSISLLWSAFTAPKQRYFFFVSAPFNGTWNTPVKVVK